MTDEQIPVSRESTPLIGTEPVKNANVSAEDEFSLSEGLEDAPEEKYDVKMIVISLWVGSFLSALDSTVVASTMSGIASEFNDSKNISWIASSYLLTNTAFQPLYGKTSDILGRKACLVFAQFWFGLGCLLCCFSTNLTQFAVARAIAGVGGGGLSSLSSIVVSDIVSLQDRGIYQGYANMMYATAQSLGGPIGGFCLQTIGWRWMFAMQVPATAVCMWLAVKHVNIRSSSDGGITRANLARIDFFGSFSLVVSTSSLLFMLSIRHSTNGFSKLALPVVFICGLCSFVVAETRIAREPVIPPHLFKGVLGLTAFIACLAMISYYGTLFVVPLYLEVVQGVSASGAGTYIISQVVPVAVGSMVAGGYLRNISGVDEDAKNAVIQSRSGKLVIWSLVLESVGLVLIQLTCGATTPDDSHAYAWKFWIVLGLATCGYGCGMLLVALLVLAVAIVGKEGQAAASSMNYLFRSVGQVLGVSVPLALYNRHLIPGLDALLSEEHPEQLEKLLKDTDYIRNGLPEELKSSVLKVFKTSATLAYTPGIATGIVGIGLSVLLIVI